MDHSCLFSRVKMNFVAVQTYICHLVITFFFSVRIRTSSKKHQWFLFHVYKQIVENSLLLELYVYIIDQARGQDGWILAEFSFFVFMDRDEVEVHKNEKRERGQYSAILTELAWSIKDLLYGTKSTEKNDLRTCLFSSTEKEPS